MHVHGGDEPRIVHLNAGDHMHHDQPPPLDVDIGSIREEAVAGTARLGSQRVRLLPASAGPHNASSSGCCQGCVQPFNLSGGSF
jgi:hypothetical protein